MQATLARQEFGDGGGRSEQEHAIIIEEIQKADPSFREMDNYNFGVTDSAKEVFFGSNDVGIIAVKPFCELGIRDRAQHEADMMRIASDRGFITFPNPQVLEGTHAIYLITDYVPSVRAMNNVGWEKPINSRSYQQELVPLLGSIATFTGEMHGKGIAHGDFLLKNNVRKKDGTFLLMDLEKAEICDNKTDEQKIEAFAFDLSNLTSSMIRKQFLSTPEWDLVEYELVTHLIEPYLDSLNSQGESDEVGLEACTQALTMAETTHFYVALQAE